MKTQPIVVKTFKFTTLPNGYYLATKTLRNAEGGQDTWEEFKAFAVSECGDASKLFVWCVCNGTAHMLSLNAQAVCGNF